MVILAIKPSRRSTAPAKFFSSTSPSTMPRTLHSEAGVARRIVVAELPLRHSITGCPRRCYTSRLLEMVLVGLFVSSQSPTLTYPVSLLGEAVAAALATECPSCLSPMEAI